MLTLHCRKMGPLVSLYQGQCLSAGEEKLKVSCLNASDLPGLQSPVQSFVGLGSGRWPVEGQFECEGCGAVSNIHDGCIFLPLT